MPKRLLHSAVAFVIVLVAYWTYALVAVPWIEPTVESVFGGNVTIDDPGLADDLLIAENFPPNAWERNKPKVLDNGQSKLLFQQYKNLGDGRVRLQPLTIVSTMGDSKDQSGGKKPSVLILEAPEGALLKFNKPLKLQAMDGLHLEGGDLLGQVTIRSRGEQPGPDDDLLIGTSQVTMTERYIRTSQPVEFRFGRSHGRGSDMEIQLQPDEDAESSTLQGPNIGGIRTFTLRHLDHLHLESSKTPSKSATPTPAGDVASTSLLSTESNLPTEVRCRGPFRFNMLRKVATFERRVDVSRIHPDGPADRLQCELLSIFFADKPQDGSQQRSAKKQNTNTFDFEPVRMEAAGNPVILSAPSNDVFARGQELTYDLRQQRIVLDGVGEVLLRQGSNEIHAQRLDYLSRGKGRLGQVDAAGPGYLRGHMGENGDGPLEARWGDRLQIRPFKHNQVISLSGGATLTAEEVGRLKAPEIHFYLLEVPRAGKPDQFDLQPDRMLACQPDRVLVYRDGRIVETGGGNSPRQRNVSIDSPRISTTVEQLEVWFEQQGGATGAITDLSPGSNVAAGPVSDGSPGSNVAAGTIRPTPGAATQSGQDDAPSSRSKTPEQHFRVDGRLLLARLLVRKGRKTEVTELTVVDDVQFAETRTRNPDEIPIEIRGDWLHVVGGQGPNAAAKVIGKPAHFEGRGIGLTASNININRSTNRLWVQGPGQMDVLLKNDLQGRPLRTPTNLAVRWADHMMFNGRVAEFHGHVTANDPTRFLRTETLKTQFTKLVSFTSMKVSQQPELEQLSCHGGVFMESRTIDERSGQQTSHDRMQVADLTLHHLSKQLHANGPGWLISVRYGSADPLGDAMGPRADPRQTAAADQNDQLRRLEIHFQGGLQGDNNYDHLEFDRSVKVASALVDSWQAVFDINDPQSLGPGGVVMDCDSLTVNRMPVPMTDRKAAELVADGNVVLEGNMQKAEDGIFHARGVRMSYAEAKGLLILEGNGQSDAELVREKQIGGNRLTNAARRIQFWPKTHQVIENGIRSGSASFPGSSSAGKR